MKIKVEIPGSILECRVVLYLAVKGQIPNFFLRGLKQLVNF